MTRTEPLPDVQPDPVKARHEGAYRRGCHQSISFCLDLVGQCRNLQDARHVLRRAERIAHELRFVRRDRGNGALLDHIRGRLVIRRRKPRVFAHGEVPTP